MREAKKSAMHRQVGGFWETWQSLAMADQRAVAWQGESHASSFLSFFGFNFSYLYGKKDGNHVILIYLLITHVHCQGSEPRPRGLSGLWIGT